MEEVIHVKTLTRLNWNLFNVKSWYDGESRELKKLLGIGFYNTIFVSNNNNVTVYYDKKEGEKFYYLLEKNLIEEFFDGLCDEFFKLIEQGEVVSSNKEIFDLLVKLWPSLIIFDEFSKYPELGNDHMVRRLIKIRENTESFSYSLVKKVKLGEVPTTYILFRGRLFKKDFNEFIKENHIII